MGGLALACLRPSARHLTPAWTPWDSGRVTQSASTARDAIIAIIAFAANAAVVSRRRYSETVAPNAAAHTKSTHENSTLRGRRARFAPQAEVARKRG